MKILITGANGQLGTELQRIISSGTSEIGAVNTPTISQVLGVDIQELDISNKEAVFAYVKEHRPQVIINCAAYTHVDGCEENLDLAFSVNALGALHLAQGAKAIGAELVHISTDYVFSGVRPSGAPYGEWDKTDPQGIYGKSKLLGEEMALRENPNTYVVRTSWLYGYQGGNFVKTILNAGKKHGTLTVVDDQVGNPTNANDLAHHLLLLMGSKNYGLYHCTGEGVCSWYEFAQEFVRLSGLDIKITPISSDAYPTPTKRPAYSALDNMMLRHTVGNHMRPWQDAIGTYMKNLKEYGVDL